MSPPRQDQTTDKIFRPKQMPPCGNVECDYDENAIKRWCEQKIAASTKSETSFWIKLGMFIVPFIISFFVWVSGLDKRVSLVESKQSEITELKEQVREMKEELVNLRIQIERILSRLERGDAND